MSWDSLDQLSSRNELVLLQGDWWKEHVVIIDRYRYSNGFLPPRNGPMRCGTQHFDKLSCRGYVESRLNKFQLLTRSRGSTACPDVKFLFSSITELRINNGSLAQRNRRHAPRDKKKRRSDATMVHGNSLSLFAPNNEVVRHHRVSRAQRIGLKQ